MFFTWFSFFAYGKILKQILPKGVIIRISVVHFQKIMNHSQGKCFSETAGTQHEEYFSSGID